MLPVIGPLRPWEDPTLLQMRRLPAHVPLSGLARRSLDGAWSLELFDHPDRVPPEALAEGDRPGAVVVAVPGNWTVQDLAGRGLADRGHPRSVDLPQYTNVQMPFDGPPPRLPGILPTGVYRRAFTVPQPWRRRRTVLHVGGAESVHAVFLNGRFAGYGTDSRLPSEYDVTDLLEPGRNTLAIVVVRFSAHSYLEDQDQWWMAGLHRSVWLESRPATAIADLPVDVAFDPSTGSGSVRVRTRVEFAGGPAPGWTVRTTLTDPRGRQVGVHTGSVPHDHASPYLFEGFGVDATFALRRAMPWSAEQPDRYAVLVELLDPAGRMVHAERQLIGVRSVEVRDRQLLVNGRRVWIFGVNRHDHHPDRGKAVTVADIRADLVAMRRHNISAIRTAHYPNDDAFYDLCDELGFYVIDEANIEAHAYNRSLADDPRYRAAWLDRGARMVQRDRNHPSVIAWSLGNESGYGVNHDALAGWIRHADPTRPLHYEDAIRVEAWTDGGSHATDIVCPMYPEIADIAAYGASGVGDRPLIMCEYSHAMGNSNGALADTWDIITSTPGLQGGFLWEWKDHALRRTFPDGRVHLAYGGQFGEQVHDGNFVADGLMSADLEPHPAMREVAWCYRPVTVERAADEPEGSDRLHLVVTNRRSFTGLADLDGRWELVVDGAVAARGRLRPPADSPGDQVRVSVPAQIPPPGDVDVRVAVRWTTRRDTWFAERGHLVAWDELVISESRRPIRLPAGDPPDGVTGPEPCIFRAPIDNDGFKLMPDLSRRIGVGGKALVRWQDAGVDTRPADELVGWSTSRAERADGSYLRHRVVVPADLSDLPRIGVVWRLPARFSRMRWLGRGPHENYPDRNRAAMTAVWEAPLDELPYLVPQEFGLRTACRWLEMADPDSGDVVRFDDFTVPLHVSATRAEVVDLYQAATAADLPVAGHVVVHLDVAHRGLGTASCGPDVADRYRIGAGRFAFGYRVSATAG